MIGHTEFSAGNEIEVPCRIILKVSDYGYVTRFQRKDDHAEFWGHYLFCSLEDAKAAFVERVEEHNKQYPPGNVSHVGKITWV